MRLGRGGHGLLLHIHCAGQLVLGRQRQRQRVHHCSRFRRALQRLLGQRHAAGLLLAGQHIGQVVQRQHIARLLVDHLAVQRLGIGRLAAGHGLVAQVQHEAHVVGLLLAPLLRPGLGLGGLAAGHQGGMQALRRVARGRARHRLAQHGGGGVPVPAAQLDVAFHVEAHGLLRPQGLHLAGHGQGLVELVLLQGHQHLRLLHLQLVGCDLGGAAHRGSRATGVAGGAVGVGQAQLRQGRARRHRGQLGEGAHRLLGVVARQLGPTQPVQQLGVVGQGHQAGLGGIQRGLGGVVAQVVVHQQHAGGGVRRVGGHRVGEPLGHLLWLAAAACRQLGQGQHGAGVLGVALQRGLEAGLGGIGLLVGQVQRGQAGQRGQVVGVLGQAGLEVLAGGSGVLGLQRDAAAQLVGQGVVGQLGGQVVDGLQCAGHVIRADQHVDQRHVAGGALVSGGHGAQLGQRRGALALGHVGQRQRQAHARVVGLELGRAGEAGVGRRAVALHQLGLGGQGQHVHAGAGLLQQRRQRGQGLVGLPAAHLHLGQLGARALRLGEQLHRLGEVGLGLGQRVELQLHLAGHHQHLGVLWRAAQQLLGHLAGVLQVAALFGQHGVEEQRLRMAWRHLLQRCPLRVGGGVVGGGQMQADQRGVGGHAVGLALQRLLVGGDGGRGRRPGLVGGGAGQQVALHQPGVGVVGLLGQQCLHLGQRGGVVATGGGEPGAQQQGGGVVGRGAQHAVEPAAGAVEVAGAGLGQRQRGVEPGLGRWVGERGGAELLHQQRALAQPHQCRCQQWDHLVLRVLQFQRTAQFHLGAGHVATVVQQLAEQEARLAVVGRLLQGAFQADAGGFGVLFGQRGAGLADQLGRAGLAAAGQAGHQGQHQRTHRRRAGTVPLPSLAVHRLHHALLLLHAAARRRRPNRRSITRRLRATLGKGVNDVSSPWRGTPPVTHETGRTQRTPRNRLCRAAGVAPLRGRAKRVGGVSFQALSAAPASSAALPPAAAVLIVSVCSAQKR